MGTLFALSVPVLFARRSGGLFHLILLLFPKEYRSYVMMALMIIVGVFIVGAVIRALMRQAANRQWHTDAGPEEAIAEIRALGENLALACETVRAKEFHMDPDESLQTLSAQYDRYCVCRNEEEQRLIAVIELCSYLKVAEAEPILSTIVSNEMVVEATENRITYTDVHFAAKFALENLTESPAESTSTSETQPTESLDDAPLTNAASIDTSFPPTHVTAGRSDT